MRGRRILGGIALVVAAACGASTRFDHAVADLGTQISALRNGTLDHGTHIAAASSLTEIPPEEARHHVDVNGHTSAMSSDVSEMMEACGDFGTGPQFAELRDAIASLQRECDSHLLTMDSALDLTAAQSEENRHQRAVGTLLDWMETLRAGMLDHHGHLDCMGGMH